MKKEITLKECSYQQIKELISNGKVDMGSLDVQLLADLMDYETDMLYMGKGDVDFISKCASVLDEKRAGALSNADYIAAIQKAKARAEVITASPKRAKRFVLKRVIIIAATLALLATVCTAVASALGFDVLGAIKKVMLQPKDTEITESGITVRNEGKMQEYKTIEEALERLDCDIMYPTAFPNGVKLERVYVSEPDYADKHVVITTDCQNVSINIFVGYNQKRALGSDATIYQSGDLAYQVFEYESELGHIYKAFYIDGDCDYYLSAEKYEDLIFIIDNMSNMKEN